MLKALAFVCLFLSSTGQASTGSISGNCGGVVTQGRSLPGRIVTLNLSEGQKRVLRKLYTKHIENRSKEADARNSVLFIGQIFPGTTHTVRAILLLNNIFVEYLVQTSRGSYKVLRSYYDPGHLDLYQPLGSFFLQSTDRGMVQMSNLGATIPPNILMELTQSALKNQRLRSKNDIFIFEQFKLTVEHFLGAGGQGQVYVVSDGQRRFTLKTFYNSGEALRSAEGLKTDNSSIEILGVSNGMLLMPYHPSLPLEALLNLKKFDLDHNEILEIEALLPIISDFSSHQYVLEIETGKIVRIDYD